jgi:hypothetical protein
MHPKFHRVHLPGRHQAGSTDVRGHVLVIHGADIERLGLVNEVQASIVGQDVMASL